VDAIDAHREQLDASTLRPQSRRLSALRELTAEHGERALRALGGRREAERLLAGQDPRAGTAELVSLLERSIES
jgi:LAO/AO transport system kinase